MNPVDRVRVRRSRLVKALENLDVDAVGRALDVIRDALNSGRKVLVAGNGGSAGQASHLATEMVVRYARYRRPAPAIALTVDGGVITAAANDYDFSMVFARQVEALGQAGDVFVALSTSGRSENVNRAVDSARRRGLKVIYLTGERGTPVEEKCDVVIKVPCGDTACIQEAHLFIIHTICEALEDDWEEEKEED